MIFKRNRNTDTPWNQNGAATWMGQGALDILRRSRLTMNGGDPNRFAYFRKVLG